MMKKALMVAVVLGVGLGVFWGLGRGGAAGVAATGVAPVTVLVPPPEIKRIDVTGVGAGEYVVVFDVVDREGRRSEVVLRKGETLEWNNEKTKVLEFDGSRVRLSRTPDDQLRESSWDLIPGGDLAGHRVARGEAAATMMGAPPPLREVRDLEDLFAECATSTGSAYAGWKGMMVARGEEAKALARKMLEGKDTPWQYRVLAEALAEEMGDPAGYGAARRQLLVTAFMWRNLPPRAGNGAGVAEAEAAYKRAAEGLNKALAKYPGLWGEMIMKGTAAWTYGQMVEAVIGDQERKHREWAGDPGRGQLAEPAVFRRDDFLRLVPPGEAARMLYYVRSQAALACAGAPDGETGVLLSALDAKLYEVVLRDCRRMLEGGVPRLAVAVGPPVEELLKQCVGLTGIRYAAAKALMVARPAETLALTKKILADAEASWQSRVVAQALAEEISDPKGYADARMQLINRARNFASPVGAGTEGGSSGQINALLAASDSLYEFLGAYPGLKGEMILKATADTIFPLVADGVYQASRQREQEYLSNPQGLRYTPVASAEEYLSRVSDVTRGGVIHYLRLEAALACVRVSNGETQELLNSLYAMEGGAVWRREVESRRSSSLSGPPAALTARVMTIDQLFTRCLDINGPNVVTNARGGAMGGGGMGGMGSGGMGGMGDVGGGLPGGVGGRGMGGSGAVNVYATNKAQMLARPEETAGLVKQNLESASWQRRMVAEALSEELADPKSYTAARGELLRVALARRNLFASIVAREDADPVAAYQAAADRLNGLLAKYPGLKGEMFLKSAVGWTLPLVAEAAAEGQRRKLEEYVRTWRDRGGELMSLRAPPQYTAAEFLAVVEDGEPAKMLFYVRAQAAWASARAPDGDTRSMLGSLDVARIGSDFHNLYVAMLRDCERILQEAATKAGSQPATGTGPAK
jgi:hypothetical protein